MEGENRLTANPMTRFTRQFLTFLAGAALLVPLSISGQSTDVPGTPPGGDPTDPPGGGPPPFPGDLPNVPSLRNIQLAEQAGETVLLVLFTPDVDGNGVWQTSTDLLSWSDSGDAVAIAAGEIESATFDLADDPTFFVRFVVHD